MLVNAQKFIGTPYAAATLEKGDEEQLVINCAKVDCTTLVEYVLAQSLSSPKESFAEVLQRIRYRDGHIDGYASRLHYISDWINNGIRNGFLEDITATHSSHIQKLNIAYMSSHPEQYRQLTHSPSTIEKIKAHEQALTGQEIHWLPKDSLPPTGMSWIKNGDIIALTTNTPGLDIAHMGIAVYINGYLHLLHASSSKKRVLTDPLTLRRMLDASSNLTGIRVVRMRK